jgi:hypothetical protein
VTVYQGTRFALYSDDYLEERRQRQGITDGGRAGRASRQRNVN